MSTDNTEKICSSPGRLLDEYLAGSISKEALDELTRWASRSDNNRRYIRERIEVWFSAGAGADIPMADLEEKYNSLRKRMLQSTRTQLTATRHRRFMTRLCVGIAVMALILLIPWVAYRHGTEAMRDKFGMISIQTPAGSKTEVNLPDGTVVWLNADSRITYSQGFGVSDRHLNITGEACFNVSHNEHLPFEINDKELDLKVLGTQFTYTAYPGEKTIRVDLIDGKVFLHNKTDGSGMTLQPGERMTFDRVSRRMTRRHIDTSMSAAWKKGRLHFDETPLHEIALALSRTYGRKVSVEGRIRNRRFYGSFDISRNTIEDVLRMISTTNKVKYRYERGTYILY